MFRTFAVLVFGLAAGCVRRNGEHCANQDDPIAYCDDKHQVGYCSTCRAGTDGCRPDRPEAECEIGIAGGTTMASDASTIGVTSTSSATTMSTSGTGTEGSSTTVVDPSDSSTGEPPPPGCGNGVTEPSIGENCDGDDMPATTCGDVALRGGDLGCYPAGSGELECKYDLSNCTGAAQCGNSEIEGKETCDNDNLDGQNCESISPSFIGGTLTCNRVCTFDTSACEPCRLPRESCDAENTCCAGSCGVLTMTCSLL